MIAIRKFDIDPNAIRAVLITHLHGDHFGGLPFFILDAQLVSRRTAPLTIAGPPGLRDRLTTALAPESLEVMDDSASHAGHAGARSGGGHYVVIIVSQAFTGLGLLQRHRLIYDALGDAMGGAIHALSIKAYSPQEI